MKLKLLLIILFFYSCSKSNINDDSIYNFDFSNDMSFSEFKIKLEDYSKNKPYPKLDQ